MVTSKVRPRIIEVMGRVTLRMTQVTIKTTARMKISHMQVASDTAGIISASQPPDGMSYLMIST
jgi:hypothetical protein